MSVWICMSWCAIYQTAVKVVSTILSEARNQVRDVHTPTFPVVNPMLPLPIHASMAVGIRYTNADLFNVFL